jgi:serine/threonine-protein kinase
MSSPEAAPKPDPAKAKAKKAARTAEPVHEPVPPAPPPRPQQTSRTDTMASQVPNVCPACGGRYPADFKVCPKDATPLEDAPASDDPLIGSTIAESYEIVRVLGEGAMGKVYEAKHTRLPKRYAIKMLHADLAREPAVVARFQREAESASALEHPNVVSVFDVSITNDGRPFIVQELLSGVELGEYLDRTGRLAPGHAANIVRQIARALGAAHARGIVHRDVKPENVILLGDVSMPMVKVLDFGISKVAEEGSALTKTGMVIGTPAYMAPEQARGDKVDARADIYSAGAILYRIVTGRKPYEGLDPIATLSAVLSEDPPRPRSVQHDVPEALELVVQRAMARDPEERLGTMADLDSELAAFDSRPSMVPGESLLPPKVDTSAKTLIAGPRAAAAAEAARRARRARPTLVLGTLAGVLALIALLLDSVLAAIRLTLDAGPPTIAQMALAGIVSMGLLIAPVVLWTRWLARSAWTSTPRAIELAQRVTSALVAASATYAGVTLGIRLFESFRPTAGVGWAGWALFTTFTACAGALASWFAPHVIKSR